MEGAREGGERRVHDDCMLVSGRRVVVVVVRKVLRTVVEGG